LPVAQAVLASRPFVDTATDCCVTLKCVSCWQALVPITTIRQTHLHQTRQFRASH
jgi:hypothetical protein